MSEPSVVYLIFSRPQLQTGRSSPIRIFGQLLEAHEAVCDTCGGIGSFTPNSPCQRLDEGQKERCPGTYREPLHLAALRPSILSGDDILVLVANPLMISA